MQIKPVSFKADGLNLAGEVYIPEVTSPSPALCLCHGIPAAAYNPSDQGYPLLARRFCAAGFVTFIFNFRGTGRSDGNLDILGWSRDLTAALDAVHHLKEVDKSQISVLGFSAGAAIAVYVAAHDSRVSSLITGACPADFSFLLKSQPLSQLLHHFRSIGLIRDKDFPPSLTEWLNGFSEISPIRWIGHISPRPLLIVHGDEDEIVPLEHAQRLYEEAGKPKDIVIIPGAKHRLRLEERSISSVLNWLKTRSHLSSSSAGLQANKG